MIETRKVMLALENVQREISKTKNYFTKSQVGPPTRHHLEAKRNIQLFINTLLIIYL